jgi:hypothetical protein
MKNERSIKAVDMAIAFGEGRATMEELNNAADAAIVGYCCCYAYAAFTAYAAYAAATAAYAAAYAATAAATAYAAYCCLCCCCFLCCLCCCYAAAADAAYVAKKQNQKETAEICRKYIGQLIIDKCNELNNKEK